MISLQAEFSRLEWAEPIHFRNLTLFPLLCAEPNLSVPGYLLLEDAISQGLARVTELNGGSVPNLLFENKAEQPVLLLDGEELIGAKQNRVLNLTILAPATQSIVIPVSCVEAGRWSMRAPVFTPADHLMYSTARAARASQVTASMRATGARRSDQSAVWAELADKAQRMKAYSATQAMSAVYERHRISLEEYLRAFQWSQRQVGVAFAVGEQVLGLDIFDHPAVMQRYLPKLVRSYALDALDAPQPKSEPAREGSLKDFLESFLAAQSFSQPSLGLGKDIRINGPSTSGAALWALDRYVHICGFATNGNPAESGIQTRISRPMRRSN